MALNLIKESFDMWSVGHIVPGMLLAGICVLYRIRFGRGIIASAFLLLAWELYEYAIGVHEALLNKTVDVFIGLASFWLFYMLFKKTSARMAAVRFTNHAAFADMWSIIHFIAGGMLALASSWTSSHALPSALAVFVALVAWEIYERVKGIGESISNSTFDVIFGMAGFSSVYFLSFGKDRNFAVALSLMLLLSFIFMRAWGKKCLGKVRHSI